MTDLHDLIRRMADELDHYRQLLFADCTERHALATEARAALAEPEQAGDESDENDCDKIFYQYAQRQDENFMPLMDVQSFSEACAAIALALSRRAQPVPEVVGVTDEELNSICDCTPWHGSPRQLGREVARAVLARWGRPAAPPAAGEVGELVAELREIAQLWESDAPRSRQLSCAADLLEVQAGEAQP